MYSTVLFVVYSYALQINNDKVQQWQDYKEKILNGIIN